MTSDWRVRCMSGQSQGRRRGRAAPRESMPALRLDVDRHPLIERVINMMSYLKRTIAPQPLATREVGNAAVGRTEVVR
jgi:hypothetical protein